MENYQYSNSSYPDSVNSSPRSREIETESASWEEPLSSSSNYKVKFMCSYGGKIRPRPHDNQLTYTGGDTKILAVDRAIKFSTFISKLSSLSDSPEVSFKYQLPGEDLDALISVTNDEDLEHMMLEYDRLYRSSSTPARLRLFIFPVNGNAPSVSSFGSDDSKPETQWFLDALNAAQVNQNLKASSPQSAPPAGAAEPTRIPDYLFGLEKGGHRAPSKMRDPSPEVPPPVVVGEPVLPPTDLQRQMQQDLQRMQISSQEPDLYGRKVDEYYQQKPPPQAAPQQHPQAVSEATAAAAYWQERHAQPFPAGVGVGGTEGPPMYLIQTPAGVYQAPMNVNMMRQVTGQVSQPYYGVQRIVPEGYREQPVYNPMAPPVSSSIQQFQQQQKPGGTYNPEGIGFVRPPVGPSPTPTSEPGYAQVSFDNAGRQVYYAPPGGVNMMQQQQQQQQPPPPHPYHAVPTVTTQLVDGRQAVISPEGKIIVKTSQPPQA